MPTGYTAKVGDGEMTELRPFIEQCARAFIGSMRDAGPNAPLPTEDTYEESSYHSEALATAYKRLAKAKSMSRTEAAAAARKEHAAEVKHNREYLAKNEETKARYEAMLEQVYAWEPPTTEHVGLKKFMVEQLATSIEFDCGGTYWRDQLAEQERSGAMSGDAWKAKEINKAHEDIEYHSEEIRKSKEVAAKNTAWIQALIGSLPVEG